MKPLVAARVPVILVLTAVQAVAADVVPLAAQAAATP